MSSNWQEHKLSEIINLIGGGTPKRANPEYWNGNIPWLSVKDFNNNNRFVSDSEECISELGLNNSSAKLLDKKSLIISARGTVGALAQLSKPMAFNQSCYGIEAKNQFTSNDFLYYLLLSSINKVKQNSHGSVFDTITKNTFESINILLPPLTEQKKISNLLGSIDKKIDNNKKQSKTLESIAKTIFKSWFVNFDPVKAKMEGKLPDRMNAETATLFPDKLVESELGLIPEGWKPGTFIDICDNIRCNVKKDSINIDDYYVGLEHIPRKNIQLSDWGHGSSVTSNKHAFVENDLLFGKLNPYFHKVAVAPFSGICSTDILVIRAKEKHWRSFMSFGLFQDKIIESVSAQSEGTRMPRTKWEILGNQPTVIPDTNVSEMYEKITSPIISRIKQMTIENKLLEDLRDTLLPKLISGKLKIKNNNKTRENHAGRRS